MIDKVIRNLKSAPFRYIEFDSWRRIASWSLGSFDVLSMKGPALNFEKVPLLDVNNKDSRMLFKI
jgi:hypothetical protein